MRFSRGRPFGLLIGGSRMSSFSAARRREALYIDAPPTGRSALLGFGYHSSMDQVPLLLHDTQCELEQFEFEKEPVSTVAALAGLML